MSSASDPRLLEGFGDGSLHKAFNTGIQSDLSAVFTAEQSKVTVAGAVQPATTAGKVKTTATCAYLQGNSGYQKAATDNLFDLTAVTTGATGFAKVLLQLDNAGVATIKKGVESTVSQAAAAFPAPDAGKTVVGWVQLGNSYAGAALTQGELFDGTPLTPVLATTP